MKSVIFGLIFIYSCYSSCGEYYPEVTESNVMPTDYIYYYYRVSPGNRYCHVLRQHEYAAKVVLKNHLKEKRLCEKEADRRELRRQLERLLQKEEPKKEKK